MSQGHEFGESEVAVVLVRQRAICAKMHVQVCVCVRALHAGMVCICMYVYLLSIYACVHTHV